MSEEKNDNQQSSDVVNREDYNKVVESSNSLKTENEKLKSELNKVQETKKVEQEKKATEEEKKEWQNEAAEIKKQIEDLKKAAEQKKETKVSKGVVPTNQTEQQEQPNKEIKQMLDKHIPDRKVNPEKFGSMIHRYAHYKNAATREYTHEQLGMGLSLHAGLQRANPSLIKGYAKPTRDDIVLSK